MIWEGSLAAAATKSVRVERPCRRGQIGLEPVGLVMKAEATVRLVPTGVLTRAPRRPPAAESCELLVWIRLSWAAANSSTIGDNSRLRSCNSVNSRVFSIAMTPGGNRSFS